MSLNQHTFHQYIVGELFVAFREWVNENGSKQSGGRVVLGPVDVKLQEQARAIQPDLFVVLGANWKGDAKSFNGAPDLVVEVLSEDSYRIDRVVKFITYEQVGVQEYWVVNPKAQTVEIYTLGEKEYSLVGEFRIGETVDSPSLDGLRLSVKSLFPDAVQYNGEVPAAALGESVPAE